MPGRISKSPPPTPAGFGPQGSDGVRLTGDDFGAATPGSATFRGFSSHADAPAAARRRTAPSEPLRLLMIGGVVAAAATAIGIGWFTTQPAPPPPAPTPLPPVAAAPPPIAQLAAIEPAPIQPEPRRRAPRPAVEPVPEEPPLDLLQADASLVSPVAAPESEVVIITPPPVEPSPAPSVAPVLSETTPN